MMARVVLGVMAAGMVLAGSSGALGQTTVLNPTTVEFEPSPDHSSVGSDGQAIVQRYELRLYQIGRSDPTVTTDLGKPSPGSDGKIRVDFSTRTTPWPPPDGNYEARVAAVGPSGVGQSDSSNPFSFSFHAACSYTLSATSASLPATGGTASVSVSAGSGCEWTVTGAPGWLSVGPASGGGNATIAITASPNASTSARTASLTAAGRSFTVTQAGVPACSYSLSSTSATVAAGGGSASITLTTGPGCSWTVTGTPSWVTLGAASGTGGATLTFTASPNTSTSARSATMTVGGRSFVLTQQAAPCSFLLSPASVAVASNGGSGSLALTTSNGCGWTASSSVPWITLGTGSGSGSRSLSYTVQKNTTGSSRTGTIQAGGKTATITQAAPVRPSAPKKPRVTVVAGQ